MTTTVSCIIRTFNEEELVGRCIDTLRAQKGPFEVDILIVDSGSTDRTLEIVTSRGVPVVEIPKSDFESFDYSYALNFGIERTSGDVIAVLSAHTIPCGEDWLAGMVAHLEHDRVVGVACKQIPWPGAHWDEVRRIRQQFPEETVRITRANAERAPLFSNAASVLLRSAWQLYPFSLPSAEDTDWARWMAESGREVVYDAALEAYHSHDEPPRRRAKRIVNLEKTADVLEGRRRTPGQTLRQAVGGLRRDLVGIRAVEAPFRRKVKFRLQALEKAWWFVVEFLRSPRHGKQQ